MKNYELNILGFKINYQSNPEDALQEALENVGLSEGKDLMCNLGKRIYRNYEAMTKKLQNDRKFILLEDRIILTQC